jgi:hypothetical protein
MKQRQEQIGKEATEKAKQEKQVEAQAAVDEEEDGDEPE